MKQPFNKLGKLFKNFLNSETKIYIRATLFHFLIFSVSLISEAGLSSTREVGVLGWAIFWTLTFVILLAFLVVTDLDLALDVDNDHSLKRVTRAIVKFL